MARKSKIWSWLKIFSPFKNEWKWVRNSDLRNFRSRKMPHDFTGPEIVQVRAKKMSSKKEIRTVLGLPIVELPCGLSWDCSRQGSRPVFFNPFKFSPTKLKFSCVQTMFFERKKIQMKIFFSMVKQSFPRLQKTHQSLNLMIWKRFE